MSGVLYRNSSRVHSREGRKGPLTWGALVLALVSLPGGCRALAPYEPAPGLVRSPRDAAALDLRIVDAPGNPPIDAERDTTGVSSRDATTDRTFSPEGSKTSDEGVDLQGPATWETVFSLKPGGKTVSCPMEWHFNDKAMSGLSGCTGVNDSVLAGATGKGFKTTHVIHLTRAYRKIRVWIRGYQYGSPDAFHVRDAENQKPSLDTIYVDGASITRSSPLTPSKRRHVFTFAAGLFISKTSTSSCPSKKGAKPPLFLGKAWVCESGNPGSGYPTVWYPNTPLWSEGKATGDGTKNFTTVSGGLGFYTIDLGKMVTDDLQVHLMQDDDREFILLTDLEIAVL